MPTDDDLLLYIEDIIPRMKEESPLQKKIVDVCYRLQGLLREQKKAKLGRPRIGESRDKPWESLGFSRRTWFRRQKELKQTDGTHS